MGVSRGYYVSVLHLGGLEGTENYQKDTELNSFNYILGVMERKKQEMI